MFVQQEYYQACLSSVLVKIFQEIEAFLKELEEDIDLIGECEEIDLIGEYDEGTNGEEVTTDEFENCAGNSFLFYHIRIFGILDNGFQNYC